MHSQVREISLSAGEEAVGVRARALVVKPMVVKIERRCTESCLLVVRLEVIGFSLLLGHRLKT
jgi:hypothetical protein